MTAPTTIDFRSPTKVGWTDIGGDGNQHAVSDPARIPSQLLTNDQVKALQQEVMRLRQKNSNRKYALRTANLACERYSAQIRRLTADRNDLQVSLDEMFEKLMQQKKRATV